MINLSIPKCSPGERFGCQTGPMRADRLVATLLLMQSRGRVTAAELAEELEISVATARRDLEALSSAGVPVYPQPGRGGGWSLVGGARTDLSGLSAMEAQALFLLAGPAASVSPDVKSALRKLVRALPDTFRADAEAAADAVVIDLARWGEREKERPELLTVLQSGIVRRRKVRFGYAKKGGEPVERVVDPWGLVDKDDVWYLIAGTEKGQRTFRVDRMSDAEVSDLPAERPDDFELSRAWERVVDQVEQRRSGLDATGLARADARTYVTGMREINIAILNGWFALSFGGAPLLAAVAAALHFRSDLRPALPWIIAGFVLLMVMLIVTMALNVPLNNALEAGFDGENTDFDALRAKFEGVWERWNLVRTLAGIGGFGCLVGGLIVHVRG
jgi:predicted DNA-binding transcriptional regulator YafY